MSLLYLIRNVENLGSYDTKWFLWLLKKENLYRISLREIFLTTFLKTYKEGKILEAILVFPVLPEVVLKTQVFCIFSLYYKPCL